MDMVRLQDAVELLNLAAEHGIKVFLDGGWGVDALIGRETRIHEDIDLVVEEKDCGRWIDILKKLGFSEVIMEYTTEDHTVWKDGKDRVVDLHRFFDTQREMICYEDNLFPKEVFSGKGMIGTVEVDCIDPENQVQFHLGYAHDEKDVHDVMLLCDTFGIPVPKEYR